MTKIRYHLIVVACFVWFFVTSPGVAAPTRKPILEMIPEEVAGFVVLNNFASADEAAAKLSKKMQLPIPSPFMIFNIATKLGGEIDTEGSLAALYFVDRIKQKKSLDEETAMFVFLIPVKSFDDFLLAFEDREKINDGIYKVTIGSGKMFLASASGYALFVSEESHAVMDTILKSKESFAKRVEPWKAWIDEQIIYGFMIPEGIKAFHSKVHISDLTGGILRESVTVELDESTDPKAETKQKTPRFCDDLKYLGFGVKVDDMGTIRTVLRCSIKQDRGSFHNLPSINSPERNPFASLPAGPFVFAGAGPLPSDFTQLLSTSLQNGDFLPLSQTVSMNTASRFFRYRKSLQSQVFRIGLPQEEQILSEDTQAVFFVQNTDESFENMKKDLEEVQEWFDKKLAHLKDNDNHTLEDFSPCKVSIEETSIEGCKTLVVTYDLSKIADGPGATLSALEKFEGKDFITKEYNIQIDEHRILSTYCNDPELQKRFIKIAETQIGGMADSDDIKKVAMMLPEDVQFLYFWSPGGTIDLFDWFMEKVAPQVGVELPFEKFPEFQKSSPIGMSERVSKGLWEFTIVIPPDTLRSSIQYCKQWQNLIDQLEH